MLITSISVVIETIADAVTVKIIVVSTVDAHRN
jgi:hypothetical protein